MIRNANHFDKDYYSIYSNTGFLLTCTAIL